MIILPLAFLPVHAYFFSSPQAIENSTSTGSIESVPTAFQAQNGSLIVTWDSDRLGQNQAFYKSYNGVSWTTSTNITSGPSNQSNSSPSISQLQNGTIILVWTANQTGHYNIYYKTLRGNVWGTPHNITESCPGCINKPYGDLGPKTVLGLNGTLWVFWERQQSSTATNCQGSVLSICRQVFYKTLTGNTWSPEKQLTTDSTWNRYPGASVLEDGSLRLVHSKWLTSTNIYNLYYLTFNGTRWSTDTPLTPVSTSDINPATVQDRNGTLWVFWSRKIVVSGTVTAYKLFTKFSPDAGQTWSPDIQFTSGGNVNATIDDLTPYAVQGNTRNSDGSTDHSLWVFYSTDANFTALGFDIYAVKIGSTPSNPLVGIWPVHNVAVTSLQVSPIETIPGGVPAIKVVVANLGDFLETNVPLTVRAVSGTNSFTIGSANPILGGGGSATFTFNWDTTGIPAGKYTIIASVSLVPGETIGAGLDNTLQFQFLTIDPLSGGGGTGSIGGPCHGPCVR
jgi:hypothetical protein